MTYAKPWPEVVRPASAIHFALLSFPIACFTLTLFTDILYWQTLNLLWLHFSEWLLLAGLGFGVLALVFHLVNLAVSRRRPSWWAVLAGLIVLLLATLNSFIHTADGWTAVVPYGLVVSILTIAAMIAAGWLAGRRLHHV